MNDIRKKYIINIAGDYFNINNSLENKENISGESKLEQFLDSENCLTLCATIQEGVTPQLEFHSEIVQLVNGRMVIFFKNKQCRLNENNVHEIVQLVVLQGSPTASLYHTLHNVFTPLLLQESKKNNALNQNLQRQLTTFQTNLRSAAFAADNDNSNLNEHNSLSVISTLEHELDYWNSIIPTIKNSDQRDSATAFRDILIILARDFRL